MAVAVFFIVDLKQVDTNIDPKNSTNYFQVRQTQQLDSADGQHNPHGGGGGTTPKNRLPTLLGFAGTSCPGDDHRGIARQHDGAQGTPEQRDVRPSSKIVAAPL